MKWFQMIAFAAALLGAVTASAASTISKSFTTSTLAAAKTEGLWAVWYDGAPVYTRPVASTSNRKRTLSVETTFTCEAIGWAGDTEWIKMRVKGAGDPLWIPFVYCRHPVLGRTIKGNLAIGSEEVDRYIGLSIRYRPDDLERIPKRYCYNDLNHRLRSEAAKALYEMLDMARKEAKLRILVLSSYRTIEVQTYLCRKALREKGIGQNEVERPGHSEHHLGTAVDLTRDDGSRLLKQKFGDTAEGKWLSENCRRFGFLMTYTPDRAKRDGIGYEPWHFRYMGRAAVKEK